MTIERTYDFENHIQIIKKFVSGVATEVGRFYYDADGAAVKWKGTDGAITVTVGPHYEKNSVTGISTSYYFFGGQRVAMRQGSTVHWIHGDSLGSTSLTTNSSGNAVGGTMRYKPFGEPRNGGAMPTDFRYTGQRELGRDGSGMGSLMFYGARAYSPVLGRFISADTVVPGAGNPQAFNRYSYVLNRPLKYTDPSGHDPLDQTWRDQFQSDMGRAPEWFDEQIRLFSLAYPNEYSFDKFYVRDPYGTARLRGGQEGYRDTLQNNVPAGRDWRGLEAALGRLAGAYYFEETEQFLQDASFLWGGTFSRSEMAMWRAILPTSDGGAPIPHPGVHIRRDGLSTTFTGVTDGDANVHHFFWAAMAGYTYRQVGAYMNAGHEAVGFIRNGSFATEDLLLGEHARALGSFFALSASPPQDFGRFTRIYLWMAWE